MGKPIYGVTVGTPLNPNKILEGVAEALQSKANAIVMSYSGAYRHKMPDYTFGDGIDRYLASYELHGKSAQASGTPKPTNILEITNTEDPTISIAVSVSGDESTGELDLPTVYTFNGITLKGVGGGRDMLVMKNGRIKLVQKVFHIKDCSALEFERTSSNGFSIDFSSLGITLKSGSSLCNMLKYNSSTTSGTAFVFRVSGNKIITRNCSVATDTKVAEFKDEYAKDMEFYLPLATPIETDVTELFLDNLSIRDYGYLEFSSNLSTSSNFTYIEDTKTYIDAKFNELATALVANA
jgi:hypothetical protein